jgi:hypothetical protein
VKPLHEHHGHADSHGDDHGDDKASH